MSNKQPVISIITPTFNAANTLRSCIESVVNQTYQNIEYWFIDGQSTDNTLEIISEYALKYPFIKYISEKDAGIYDAMNKGINLASGGWLYFIGADDTIYDSKVLESIFFDSDMAQYDLIYGSTFFNSRQNCIIEDYKNINIDKYYFITSMICHQAVFTKKALFDTHYFDINFQIGADRILLFDIFSMENIKIFKTDVLIAKYSDTGFTGNLSMYTIIKENFLMIVHMTTKLSNKEKEIFDKQIADWLHHFWINLFMLYGEKLPFVYQNLKRIDEKWGRILIQKMLNREFWKYRSSEAGAYASIATGTIWVGLLQLLFVIIESNRLFYHLKNLLYWLNIRRKS